MFVGESCQKAQGAKYSMAGIINTSSAPPMQALLAPTEPLKLPV